MHALERLGVKKATWNAYNSSADKRKTLYFTWEIDRYDLTSYPKENWEESSKVTSLIDALTARAKDLAEYAGVDIEDVNFELDYEKSYYDSVNINFTLSVTRQENDEEYALREDEIKKAALKAAEIHEKNEKKKIAQEKKELARLLKKYGKDG